MVTLRLATSADVRHDGEIYGCAFSPDGTLILSAGWDAQLRSWDAASGSPAAELRVGAKPLACCAISPDGKHWLAGSMEGTVSIWDAQSQQLVAQSHAHTRPVSAICYSVDGQQRATASWDRGMCIVTQQNDRDATTLHGHEDIVAGCCFVPDGHSLMSWSHDRTVRLWNAEVGQPGPILTGHRDRVTAGGASPDGCWAATGSRNGQLILWTLQTPAEANAIKVAAELRLCAFLLDGETLLTVDIEGRVSVFSVPDLQLVGMLTLGKRVMCGTLSPRGNRLAVGCEDGSLRLVDLDGCDDRPCVVVATQNSKQVSSGLKWLFGRTTTKRTFETTCPACRSTVEVADRLPTHPYPCPHCRSSLRFSKNVLMPQHVPC